MRRTPGRRAAAWVGAALLLAGLPTAAASAGTVDDMPSCYAANQIRPEGGSAYDRLIYVVIDQTVAWNRQLETQVVDNAERLLQPGTKFVVADFSAFSQGRYLQVSHTGVIEKPLSAEQRENTPISKIGSFERCLSDEAAYGRKLAADSIAAAMQGSSGSLDRSDIMGSLQALAQAVRADSAIRKVVLVASDGLENSSVTSFYRRGAVALIDPGREMAKAKANHMLGNFGGAAVYIVGGAMLPPAAAGTRAQRDQYRDPQVLHALASFWGDWFKASDATLVEFGEPSLVEPIRFPAN